MRPFRLSLLVLLFSLAGCTSQGPTPVPPAPGPVSPQPPAPPQPSFTQTGLASFYGRAHDGKVTASGERFDPRGFTAAHRSLALGSRVRVTNLGNGQAVIVKITDRGPFVRGRIIDVSLAAAQALGITDKGLAQVRLEVWDAISPAS
jgi:rare lipoprotein A